MSPSVNSPPVVQSSPTLVHLFVPCYVDQLYPQVAEATAAVLRRAGCEVRFDERQTCCGQPMSNSGCAADAAKLARRHLDVFRGTVSVSPSASCVSQVRHHFHDLGLRLDEADGTTMANTFELSEFLVKRLGITEFGARFPHKVGLHASCHGLRELGLGAMSERRDGAPPSPAELLLAKVAGLDLVKPKRPDECCGFGGTFAVAEAGLSARMGQDRCNDFASVGAEFVTATDMSCLMHLDGVSRRSGGPRAIHLAEILVAS
jgi:L-lactate dehydrogenase complex protein LldE